ncbi:signal recognition particle-docking protein FtsY [Companilactobacillus insicii]|uniref:signal recognition particle-docking protein FtsY n=1 Tax=Companilactobacillus insicii TaxID=1732567 RepID=UPI000F76D254|nr:signal recognition particle-docking protein FtsY [Companilactobacillus insicii]
MGLFDRIKKAFTGKGDEEEKKEQEAKKAEETSEEQSSSASDSSDSDTSSSEEKTSEPIDDNDSSEDNSDTSDSDENVTDVKESVEDESDGVEEVNSEPVDESSSKQEEEPVSSTDETEISSSEETTESDPGETTEESAEEDESEDKDDIKEYDEGLKKSRNSFGARFNRFLANFRSVDEEFFDDLEELLIESDVGYETALKLSDELREEVKLENVKKRSDVSDVIVRKLVDMYDEEGKKEDNSLKFSADKTPTVFLFVGVNGAGKTTTIGKLAHRYQKEGKKVLLAAGDTFRAGAIEQLQEWGRRVDVPVEASKPQTDPASVVYDAVQRAMKDDYDILLVDTAGRLQNKEGLMRELEKIKRVITRELPEAPQEVLLVLDGSTGQNALSQAKQFNETTDVTGIVLTKIDGSSQGGIVLPIRNELHIPVKLVGLGEQMDDLRDFDPEKFIYGLFKELIVGSGK